MGTIGKFVGVLFLARDLAHRAHLMVTGPGSYAKHVSLGEFYEGLVDRLDTLSEVCIARFGEFDIPLLNNDFPEEIVASIEAQMKWLEDNRYKAVPKEDTPIQNLVDDLVVHYLHGIYKLKRLQ